MSEILTQAEIEALLNSLTGEETASTPPPPSRAKAKGSPVPLFQRSNSTGTRGASCEVYDFRRPDKFSKDQLRTLQMLHETFARVAGSALSAYLRSPVTMDLISVEQVPFEEYLRTINQSVFTILSLPPLSGQAVLEIEFGLVFSMIDRALGGPGKAIPRTVLTDIERPLVRQMVERVFGSLKSSWEGVVIVNPGIEAMETSSQLVQIAPPSDIVVTMLFEVKVGQQRGAMSLCIPYVVLKPITTKLSAQRWFANNNRRQSPGHKRLLVQQVSQTPVECTVRLGQAELSVNEFLQLKAGDVISLDQKAEADLAMLVGDVPKFAGKPALQGKNLVFTVSKPIEPL